MLPFMLMYKKPVDNYKYYNLVSYKYYLLW